MRVHDFWQGRLSLKGSRVEGCKGSRVEGVKGSRVQGFKGACFFGLWISSVFELRRRVKGL